MVRAILQAIREQLNFMLPIQILTVCHGAYVDSFTYYGNAQITGTGKSTTFTGSGDWVSYCAGSVLFTGTWAASGPCSGNLKSLPYGPAKNRKSNFADLKKTTNTVCFFDGFPNWQITYTDKGDGNYSVNGTLDVDGTNWIVYGWGKFAGHKEQSNFMLPIQILMDALSTLIHLLIMATAQIRVLERTLLSPVAEIGLVIALAAYYSQVPGPRAGLAALM
jgi:hypothetical protein